MSKEEYISVLENEVKVLREQYYKPTEEGTGHFNTTIGVLEFRIKEINGDSSYCDSVDVPICAGGSL